MLSQHAFNEITQMFHRVSGIRLTEAKRALVAGRLQKLAQAQGCASVEQYVERLFESGDEREMALVVDKLTTNETYFFREPQHFSYLASLLEQRKKGQGDLRIWSAACSSGEEPYSIAMLLADHLGLQGWEIVGTDLSSAMVEASVRALYPMERARHVPADYLKRWCLKGKDEYDGQLLIHSELRAKVRFLCANLTQPLPDIGRFDVIFLRNVLIYFDNPGKAGIVSRVIERLTPGGVLFTGHAESIASLGLPVRSLAPAVYTVA
jgi:chemotaxis protein methyltransferase CheR